MLKKFLWICGGGGLIPHSQGKMLFTTRFVMGAETPGTYSMFPERGVGHAVWKNDSSCRRLTQRLSDLRTSSVYTQCGNSALRQRWAGSHLHSPACRNEPPMLFLQIALYLLRAWLLCALCWNLPICGYYILSGSLKCMEKWLELSSTGHQNFTLDVVVT